MKWIHSVYHKETRLPGLSLNSLTELKVTSCPFYWFGFYGNDVGWIKEKDLRVHFETLYWNIVEQI